MSLTTRFSCNFHHWEFVQQICTILDIYVTNNSTMLMCFLSVVTLLLHFALTFRKMNSSLSRIWIWKLNLNLEVDMKFFFCIEFVYIILFSTFILLKEFQTMTPVCFWLVIRSLHSESCLNTLTHTHTCMHPWHRWVHIAVQPFD